MGQSTRRRSPRAGRARQPTGHVRRARDAECSSSSTTGGIPRSDCACWRRELPGATCTRVVGRTTTGLAGSTLVGGAADRRALETQWTKRDRENDPRELAGAYLIWPFALRPSPFDLRPLTFDLGPGPSTSPRAAFV